MKPLISKQDVIDQAFSVYDQVKDNLVNDNKIIAAQEKHLRPVLGALYDAMLNNEHNDFVAEYIKPALAYFVRHSLLPDISVQVGNGGLQTTFSSHSNAATDKQREMLIQQALDDARSLLNIAVRHIENNSNEFPEYRRKQSANKPMVSIIGGVVITDTKR